ncbi:MAG: sensor histidine kinase, partial [Acetobacteraceae bacterium]
GPDAAARRVTAVIGFALPPSSFARVLAEQGIPAGPGWTGAITDRAGRIVARSRNDGRLTGQPMRPEMQDRIAANREGVLLASTTREGVPAMVAFTHAANSGFIAVRTIPDAEFQGPLRAALFRIIGFGTLVTALALGLALLVARRTVAAFQSLTRLVEGQGPPDRSGLRTGLRDADELAAAFAFALEERSRSERHRRLVVAELNHRVKNVLATVQAVAAQTLRGHPGGDSAQIGADLDGRLRALARAHDMLTAISWEDAALQDVVQAALAPWRGDDTAAARIDLSGLTALAPSQPLSPAQAQTLALALHELATNALKYGALSTPQGRVTVECRMGPEGEVALDWVEAGGPPVAGPPTRRGFGMRLLERALARDLGAGAGVELRFEPGGVRATIRFSPPGTGAD